MEEACYDGHENASNTEDDEESDLNGRDIFLGRIECLDVLFRAQPIGIVEVVCVNDDLPVLIVLARKNVIDEVTHLFIVRLLLCRLLDRWIQKRNVSDMFDFQ